MEEYTQFTMRMNNALYERLKESALKNKRSIAKELEYITEAYLNNDIEKRIQAIENAIKSQSNFLHYLSSKSAADD